LFYTVYRVRNLINGKYYIGVHKTGNPDDDYLGSGHVINLAIKKYGRENFRKEVLFSFDSHEEAFEKEKELIYIDEYSYNISEGGLGNYYYINQNGMNNNGDRTEHRKKGGRIAGLLTAGKIWIKNDINSKRIYEKDLAFWEEKGYIRGRIKKKN